MSSSVVLPYQAEFLPPLAHIAFSDRSAQIEAMACFCEKELAFVGWPVELDI
jgi:hypothetical protein